VNDGGVLPLRIFERVVVVNVRDAAWVTNERLASACTFEGEGTPPFGEVGFTLGVLQQGQASALYHRESNQEDFLVLAGECLLLIEGEERLLCAWDFVHCPPETEHIFVGAGDGPCVIFMSGGRTGEKRITYPRSELAAGAAEPVGRLPWPRCLGPSST
jgi:quercetin dioxygenase-like cupin family protein